MDASSNLFDDEDDKNKPMTELLDFVRSDQGKGDSTGAAPTNT